MARWLARFNLLRKAPLGLSPARTEIKQFDIP